MGFTRQRFLINNLATADNITASSQGNGTIQQAKLLPWAGTATVNPLGNYTGASNLLYIIQCDGAGTIDAGATIRWRTNATAVGTWEATGVAAVSTAITLNNGAQVSFGAGTLVLNDLAQFWAYAEYGPGNLFVNNRDAFWKSATFTTLVSNGTFSSATTGWTAVDCTIASIGGGQSGNCLEMTRTGGTAQYAHQTIATVSGEKYRVTLYVASGTSGNEAFKVTAAGADIITGTTTGSWVSHTGTFIATGATTVLALYKDTATAGTMLFDTVSVYEMPSLLIDAGSATLFTAIVLADHNLSSTATVTLAANATNAWTSPSYSLDILSGANTDPSVDYISQTYQYLKYFFDDVFNSDGYISIGKLYAGTYAEFTGIFSTLPWGSVRSNVLERISNTSSAGKRNSRTYSTRKAFATEYKPIRTSSDLETLQSVWDATFDIATGRDKAIWLHYFYDEEDTMYLCKCTSNRFDLQYVNYAYYQVSLDWEQEVITRTI